MSRPERDKSLLRAAGEAQSAYQQAKRDGDVWAALDALFDYADSKVLALNAEIIYDKHYQVPGIVAARLLEALDALRESEAQDHLVTKVGFLDALLREARKGQAR